MGKPKIYAHSCYIGHTGYNNHTRDFFRELSKSFEIKVRNFTVPTYWNGYTPEPFDNEDYLTNHDKKLLVSQALFGKEQFLVDRDLYPNHPNNFEHNINLVLAECNHHFFYQNYDGPKIGYTVWETTRLPEQFFNSLKGYDQIWVASEWQKECTIEQGMDKNKVKVVPEAVDGNTFYPNKKATLPEYDDNRFKFVLFGRWDYRKSTKEIIEAFLDEFDKDEPIDLVLSIDNVFARDKFETTEERLKHYKLVDPRLKIKHFPTREEYIKYLQKGHVFLSCARSEGWNLPLIEAMACGTPSIYSNCSAQLEFAKGKGLPVKIKGTIPALGGEYSTYSQSDLPGEFYQPDYEDLKKVMRNAYENYDKHKKKALIESEEIRNKFTWKNAAKIANKEITKLYNNLPPNEIKITFNSGPKVEILGSKKQEYFIEFINGENNKVIHSSNIKNNMWTQCNKTYYIPWVIKINGEVAHTFNLKDKTVKISFDSNSLGDTLAWAPQAVEFQKKHNCKVIVSTFHNSWFEKQEEYKNLTFIEPNKGCECYVQYKIGWFRSKNGDFKNSKDHPNQVNTIPLIQAATDILGLPYKEINYGVYFKPKKRPIKQKYICIGPQATSGCKEWPHDRWRELAKKFKIKGYKVVSLSLKGFSGPNIISKSNLPWDELFNYLYHAELFIGLGSGLSWINWALNKHTLMLNGFSTPEHEFVNNITRVQNFNVCNGCWTKPESVFDAGDWDWCPIKKGTDEQHICQKSITVDQVLNKSFKFLTPTNKDNFIWITGGDKHYLSMIEVLAKSLLRYSKYKLIVYGFNCDSEIDLPNVINKRVDFKRKTDIVWKGEQDLINKDFSMYYAKYLASIDSVSEGYDYYAWLDGDAFVTEHIDKSLKYLNLVQDYPLFMRYYHEDIKQWRNYSGIELHGRYGTEICSYKNIKRNPNNRIIATGFYFYDINCIPFFDECMEIYKELYNAHLTVFVDDNAISEERIANYIMWRDNNNSYLPVTWDNYYSSEEEIKVPNKFTKEGFDVMYDETSLTPYFFHGPDPSVKEKNADVLNHAFNEYNLKKLMVIAHPDDELIFGGAELINYGHEYKIVCITNPDDENRVKEFIEIMGELNIGSWEILDYKDTLYPDGQTLNLTRYFKDKKWEKVVTHNPIGEYGHPQHKLIFDTVKSLTDDFYVFGKSDKKLNNLILHRKKQLLDTYQIEKDIISHILTNNGSWFKSNNNTNYIEYECIEKYDPKKDKTKYIACYDK